MTYLILMFASVLLLAGFLLTARYEAVRGVRLFARFRENLDERARRLEFIVAHVDFVAFLREESRHLAIRLGHDVAHVTLQAVRAIERLLSRLVRNMRARHAIELPQESAREFVRTLSDLKGRLEATRPVREQKIHSIG